MMDGRVTQASGIGQPGHDVCPQALLFFRVGAPVLQFFRIQSIFLLQPQQACIPGNLGAQQRQGGRLDNIVIASGFQTAHHILQAIQRRIENDRRPFIGGNFTDFLHRRNPVHLRHHDVHEDQIGRFQAKCLNRLRTIGRNQGNMPQLAYHGLHLFDVGRRVVSDQDF